MSRAVYFFFSKTHYNEFLPCSQFNIARSLLCVRRGSQAVWSKLRQAKHLTRGKLVDSDDLKQQISSVQDRLTLLVSEYVGDMVLVKKDVKKSPDCSNFT